MSPVGCFSWWGRSAPEAAPKPPRSVRTGLHSEALFPSHGSVDERKKEGLTVRKEGRRRMREGLGVDVGIMGKMKSGQEGDEVRKAREGKT